MKEKIELNVILRALMTSKNLSESELSRQTGIGQPVIHRMLSGETENPKIGTLRPIAHYFSLSVGQLIGDVPLPRNYANDDRMPPAHQWTQVPLFTWEQATRVPEIDPKEADSSISTDYKVSEYAYALRISDSTMEPQFPRNSIVIIDPAFEPVDREFAMVHIHDQARVTFKQVLLDGEKTYLKPLNSDFQITDLTENYNFKGVIVQSRCDFQPIKRVKELAPKAVNEKPMEKVSKKNKAREDALV